MDLNIKKTQSISTGSFFLPYFFEKGFLSLLIMSILLSKNFLVDLKPFALIKLISSIFSSGFKSILSCTL
nr:MAG TPA: hypothetical protein [Caudoviricetes sp.]